MKKAILPILMALLSVFLPVSGVKAATLAATLSGRILLDVQSKGEAWYVDPVTQERYFLGRPTDAFAIMRQLALGISEKDFQKIAQEGTTAKSDAALAKRLSGRIILRVERNGEAWYVNPLNLKNIIWDDRSMLLI